MFHHQAMVSFEVVTSASITLHAHADPALEWHSAHSKVSAHAHPATHSHVRPPLFHNYSRTHAHWPLLDDNHLGSRLLVDHLLLGWVHHLLMLLRILTLHHLLLLRRVLSLRLRLVLLLLLWRVLTLRRMVVSSGDCPCKIMIK